MLGYKCAILGLLACTMLMGAGCGESDEESTPLTAYVAKADEICVKHNKKIDGLGSPSHVEKVVISGLRAEVRELRSLSPPAAQAARIEEFLAALELMALRAESNPPYVARAERPFLRTELMGEHLGFKVCGNVEA